MHNDIVSIVISLIASANQLHSYSVRQLFFALKEDSSQQPLSQVAAWCLGEYGEQLLVPCEDEDDFGPVSKHCTTHTTSSHRSHESGGRPRTGELTLLHTISSHRSHEEEDDLGPVS